jgi:hypothetical protein
LEPQQESEGLPKMDKCVSELVDIVINHIDEKGLENIDIWYLSSFISSMMRTLFRRVLEGVLSRLDSRILQSRDKQRYRFKQDIARSFQTLFGTFSYLRAYYEDRQTGKRVFLLDDVLGVDRRIQFSPVLGQLCAGLNAFGLSYRGVANILELLYGERVISHQQVREYTLRMAEKMKEVDAGKDIDDQQEGESKADILFVEADGFWLSRQKEKGKGKNTNSQLRSKFEVQMVVVHEGWERRYKKGQGKAYRLKRPRFYTAVSEEEKKTLWETVRGDLYRTYSNLDEIQIVINGDGALWIRKGVDHFRKALYQYDRFHISRDLRSALRGYTDLWKKAKKALDEDRIEELHPLLAECLMKHPSSDEERKKQILDLISRIERDQEFIVDYRKRIDPSLGKKCELRGLGAAEPSVKRFKHRMKSVGKAWSEKGANAIAQVLSRYLSGAYADYLEQIGQAASERDIQGNKTGSSRQNVLSASQVPEKIKGRRIGTGAIRGSIAPLRPGYSGMATTLRKMTA